MAENRHDTVPPTRSFKRDRSCDAFDLTPYLETLPRTETIDPRSFWATSGHAPAKAAALARAYRAAGYEEHARVADALERTLEDFKGDHLFLETEWDTEHRLLAWPKDRKKPRGSVPIEQRVLNNIYRHHAAGLDVHRIRQKTGVSVLRVREIIRAAGGWPIEEWD